MKSKKNKIWLSIIWLTIVLAAVMLSLGMVYPAHEAFGSISANDIIWYKSGYPISINHVNIFTQFVKMFSEKNIPTDISVLISISIAGFALFIIAVFEIIFFLYGLTLRPILKNQSNDKIINKNSKNSNIPF